MPLSYQRNHPQKLNDRIRLLNQENLMFRRLVESIRDNKGIEEFMREVIQIVCSGMRFKRAGLFLIDPEKPVIRLALGLDPKGRFETGTNDFEISRKKGFNGLSDIVNGYKKYHLRNGRSKIKDQLDTEEIPVLNNAVVPLEVGKGQIIGALAVDNLNVYRSISETEVKTLQNFATQVGLGIESIRTYRELSDLAVNDRLTGLYNLRYFERILELELQRARRYGRSLSLILADIDQFKKINETYGKTMGDHVLRNIAEQIQNSIRNVDIAARIGGDEFAVILPETPSNNINVVTKRLLEEVGQAIHLAGQDFEPIRLTLSMGLCSYQGGRVDSKAVIQMADESLQKAQRQGGNRYGKMKVFKK